VDGIQARSVGTEEGARVKVTAGHLGWADLIFVMEPKHARRLRAKFAEELAGKPVLCLHIPDDYQFMQPELIALLESAVAPHLPLPHEQQGGKRLTPRARRPQSRGEFGRGGGQSGLRGTPEFLPPSCSPD